jgi:hypothetical protein
MSGFAAGVRRGKGVDCAVLDLGLLDGLREAEALSGRAGLVEGLVSSFLFGLPERVEQLLRASSEGGARPVRRVAHPQPRELERLMGEVSALQEALKE